MIRVLQIIPSLEDGGGVQKRLIDNYINMDKNHIHFDFLVHGTIIGELEPVVESIGCKVFHVREKKSTLFGNILDISSIIKNGNYQIIQSHMGTADGLIMVLSLLCGVRIRISHSHLAYLNSKGVNKLTDILLSKMINIFGTDFWGCSRDACLWLFGKNKKNYTIIPNAIDVDKFKYSHAQRDASRAKLKIEKDEFAIVNVGRLYGQKNQSFLLKIFREIYVINNKCKLFIVGDGELLNSLKMEAEELGILGNTYFLGVRNDVDEILQAMDLMIHTALFEGLGNVLIESQAAGLPVIASKEGIPQETNISHIIKYMSLTQSPKEWANEAFNFMKLERKDISIIVKQAGYDVVTQGQILEKKYQKLIDRENNKYK